MISLSSREHETHAFAYLNLMSMGATAVGSVIGGVETFRDLSTVEELRKELREKYIPNKAYKSLDAVEKALCKGLQDLHADPNKVSSRTNVPYLQVTC